MVHLHTRTHSHTYTRAHTHTRTHTHTHNLYLKNELGVVRGVRGSGISHSRSPHTVIHPIEYLDTSLCQIPLPWPVIISNSLILTYPHVKLSTWTHLHDKYLYVDPSPCQIEYSDTSACQISLSWPIRISNWVPGHIDQIPLSGPIPYVKLSTWTHPHVKSIYVDPIHAHHRKAPPFSQAINKFKLFYSPPGCSIRFSVTSRY